MLNLFDRYEEDPEPEDRTCKFCKVSGLHWEDTDSGWRLFDENDELHHCQPVFTPSSLSNLKPKPF